MSNFKCKECGTVNIDCGKEGFKTTKEIELEKQLKIAEDINKELRAQCDTYTRLMYIYKNVSKSRKDSEIVINYIDKLEKKLKIAEEALIEQDNYFKEIENIISKYRLTESVIKVTSINPLDVQEILNITRKAKGVK